VELLGALPEEVVDGLGPLLVDKGARDLADRVLQPGPRSLPTLPRREKVPGVDPELLGVLHSLRKILRPFPELVHR
jgi:hypothetical protein